MTTIQAMTSNSVTSKFSSEGVKGIINKGIEVGENIAELLGFTSEVLESKTNKDVDPFAAQREEFMEIINNEELSMGEKVGQIKDNFEEDIPKKYALFSGIEIGTKIGEWIKGLFSKPTEQE